MSERLMESAASPRAEGGQVPSDPRARRGAPPGGRSVAGGAPGVKDGVAPAGRAAPTPGSASTTGTAVSTAGDAIVTRGLTKRFGRLTAVDDLSLTVHRGELLALLGVNGAGKSTTISMLTCALRPTAGDATVEGSSILGESGRVRAVIGVSPQGSAVAHNLSVRENIELMAGVHGLERREARAEAARVSATFGLESMSTRRAGELSGGWQRRLSLAMALVSDPRVLFLDEPTAGLDVLARNELWDIIRSMKGRTTILLTTHSMDEAESLADRVAIMDAGRLVACDSPRALERRTDTGDLEHAFLALVGGGGR